MNPLHSVFSGDASQAFRVPCADSWQEHDRRQSPGALPRMSLWCPFVTTFLKYPNSDPIDTVSALKPQPHSSEDVTFLRNISEFCLRDLVHTPASLTCEVELAARDHGSQDQAETPFRYFLLHFVVLCSWHYTHKEFLLLLDEVAGGLCRVSPARACSWCGCDQHPRTPREHMGPAD